MRKKEKTLILTGLLAAGGILSALDPGGVSVDFNMLKGPSESAAASENLLKDGDFENREINLLKPGSSWRGGSWVWKKGLKDAAHRKRITDGQIRMIGEGTGIGGSSCAVIDTPEALRSEQNADGDPWMSSFIVQNVGLPDSETPVKYTLQFKVKGKIGNSKGVNTLRMTVNFNDKLPGVRGGKATRRGMVKGISLPPDYELRSCSFVAPPHTRRLEISFTLYGQGKVFLDDVSLTKTPVSEAAKVYVSPWSFLDNTYCIGENQPGVIVFTLQNEQRTKFRDLTLNLDVPAGFKFHSVHKNCRLRGVTANPDGSSTVKCSIQFFTAGIPAEGYYMWTSPAVTLIPEVPASDKRYPLTYRLSDGDWQGSAKTLDLKVIEPLQGKQPKYFITGPQVIHEFDLPEDKIPVIRDFLVRSGINALHGGREELRKAVKSAGIVRYIQPFHLCNGYRIGGVKNRTPESYFRTADGKPFTRREGDVPSYTCPVEVYKRGAFYRSEVMKMLEDYLVNKDNADHFMPNWEPYYLDSKGCFCERCREEFVLFMKGKAEPDTIRSKWPKKVLSTWKNDWIRFRSWQHARLCATLEQDIHAIGKKAGKDSHFIIEFAFMAFTENYKDGYAQYSPVDFMSVLPWIDPWGPYLFSNFTEKYIYEPGIHLWPLIAGEENQAFVRRYVKDPARRPELIALPHGVQSGTWVTEPESFAFNVLSSFVIRWKGVFGYFFPQGYDHRYWNAYAKANKIIAEHEETVLKGNVSDQVRFVPATPLPKPFSMWSLTGISKREIFQFRAFRKGEEIVAALGNFWLKGELFANMKISGLAAQRQYAVNSSEGYSLGVFSGAELEKGILVHAGALRWNFFRIRPGSAPAGKVVSQKEMKSEMRKRLPKIEKMFAWEKEYAAKMQAEIRGGDAVNDFKKVKPLSSNSVSLKAVRENDRDLLEITVPDGRILIDPAKGASAVSLKIKGKELVHAQGFAKDGFWSPKKAGHLVEKGYLITGMKKTTQGIEIEFTHNVSNLERKALAGLKIIKSFLFTPRGMTVKTRLSSHAMTPMRFAFRFHNIPSHLADPDGRAVFGGTDLERSHHLKIVRFGAAAKEIDTAYSVGKFLDAKAKSFTLRRAGYPELSISLGGAPAYGVIFWDEGFFSTAEPVFRTIELEPGASKDFIMDMKW